MTGGGVRNPPSRGAVCEQHKHGSVGAGAGNRPGYPTDGDYPAAAYAAVDLLVERVPPPRRFNKDWRSHIESLIRDAVEPDDHRTAATIADAAEPILKATRSSIDNAASIAGLDGVVKALGSMTAVQDALKAFQPTSGLREAMKSLQFMAEAQSAMKSLRFATGLDDTMRALRRSGALNAAVTSLRWTTETQEVVSALRFTSGLDEAVRSLRVSGVLDGAVESIRWSRELEDLVQQAAAEVGSAAKTSDPETQPLTGGVTEPPPTTEQLGNREWVFIVALAEVVRRLALEQPDVTEAQAALVMVAVIWLLSKAWST